MRAILEPRPLASTSISTEFTFGLTLAIIVVSTPSNRNTGGTPHVADSMARRSQTSAAFLTHRLIHICTKAVLRSLTGQEIPECRPLDNQAALANAASSAA
jgi:hypothetical protein